MFYLFKEYGSAESLEGVDVYYSIKDSLMGYLAKKEGKLQPAT